MKKLRNCFAALIFCGMMILLCSCTAWSEFEQLGPNGWLELGSGEVEPNGTTEAPSAVPSLTPENTTPSPTNTPNTSEPTPTITITPDRTSLPEIPKSPTVEELLSALENKNFSKNTVMLSYTGDPEAFTGINSSKIITALGALQIKYSLGATLYNQRNTAELEDLLKKGEYFADLLYIPFSEAVSYAEKGYLTPITEGSLSFNTDGAYYPNACLPYMSGNGELYFVLPSASTPYESSIVIYCNTELLKGLTGLTDIVSITNEGDLTVDLLYRYISAAKEGIKETGEDGITFLDTNLSRDFLTRASNALYRTEKNKDIASYLLELCSYSSSEDSEKKFFNGETLFLISHVSSLRDFRESADAYAILPLPKDKAEDELYPVIYDPDKVYVFALPHTSVNSTEALALVDGISLISRYEFRYNFIESLYELYIRRHDSIPYTTVSRFDGIAPAAG